VGMILVSLYESRVCAPSLVYAFLGLCAQVTFETWLSRVGQKPQGGKKHSKKTLDFSPKKKLKIKHTHTHTHTHT
jgi:hypothetical protein